MDHMVLGSHPMYTLEVKRQSTDTMNSIQRKIEGTERVRRMSKFSFHENGNLPD